MRRTALPTALAVSLVAALAGGPVLAQGHDEHQDKEKDKKAQDQPPPDRGPEKKQDEHAQQQQQQQQQRQQQEQQRAQQQQQAEQQRRAQAQQAEQQRAAQHAQQQQEQARIQQQRAQEQQQHVQQQQAEQQQRAVQRTQQEQAQQQQQQQILRQREAEQHVERQHREAAPAAPAQAQAPRAVTPLPPPAAVARPRLSAERQQTLIEQQRVRTSRYDDRLRQQMTIAEQRAQTLEQQRRTAQYRFQQDYVAHLRDQQVGLASLRAYNYGGDPYFYSAPAYRYYRGGQYYDINQYAADVLQQAVGYGYQEGFQAGSADRADRWRYDYRDSYAYQDALYGYRGLYVDSSDYEYYFRQGFQRGYEDGFYSRYRYGVASNGGVNIIASVLSQILGLRPLL